MPSPPAPLPQTGEGRLGLPAFDDQVARIAAAERGEGWLAACEDAGRFLVLSRELVASLVEVLRGLDASPVLEVAAGRGELAGALTAAGIGVIATDANPPGGAPVQWAAADEALRRYRPAVVIGSFVPVDSGIDDAVMRCPSVRHYVVLSARIGGLLGPDALWASDAWSAEPLEEVGRWMLTRHDVWMGQPDRPVLRHGEAWHFQRKVRRVGQAQRRPTIPLSVSWRKR